MLTENQRAELVVDLYDNIDFRYPLSSGATQYDFNSGNVRTVFRGREPVKMEYPAMKVDFLSKIGNIGDGMDHVYCQHSGVIVYALGELEPVIISVYAHNQSQGSNQGWHGKIISDAYIRRIESHIRRYWPKKLQGMESTLRSTNLPFSVQDISDFQGGTQRSAWELTFHIVTTNKWDDLLDTSVYDEHFEDAAISGIDALSYELDIDYSKYHSLSGYLW